MRRLHAAAFLVAVAITALGQFGFAQQRMTDKDVEATMKNLKEDAKKYCKQFDDAVKKSPIRKTSQEKEAAALAKQFQNETDGMLNQFKKTKKADAALRSVLATADRLEKTSDGAGITAQVGAGWTPVRSSLDKLAAEFNVSSR